MINLLLLLRDDIPFGKNDIPDTYTEFRKSCEARCSVRPVVETPERLKPLPPVKDGRLGDIPTLEELGYPAEVRKLYFNMAGCTVLILNIMIQ